MSEQQQESPTSSITGSARGNWASKTEFLLSCLGYAIGIGNVWRFPYLCYRNGGGAFLVPYLLMLFLCGIPLFFMETSLGQFAGTGCITIYKLSPLFKGAGYAILLVNFICTCYYNVVISYPLVFLYNIFQEKLPWEDCNNPWNTENCIKLGQTHIGNESTSIMKNFTSGKYVTPADEFFHNKILQISSGLDEMGSIVWPLFICNAITWTVVFLCIMRGVKSVGKVVYFTALFPFAVLFVLFIRGVTLPGAWDGIAFYLYPEWEQLTNLKVWADAAIQIFFSLGPGWGGIINMASFNKFHNNNRRDSILVPVINSATSIFAGFVVFSVLGFMSRQTGLPVSTVATGGPGLAFVTYPEAITMLPWPHLWAALFFLMLFFLGLDSCFVQLEAIISSVIDEYPVLRKSKVLVSFTACFVMFLCSAVYVTNGGMYYLQLIDWYAASMAVTSICIVEAIIVGWIYGMKNFVRDVEFMLEEKLHWWWPLCLRFITPSILLFIFITMICFNTTPTYHGVIYPEWSIQLGWSSCLISIICIPIYMGYKLLYLSEGDICERIKSSVKPSWEWGPADEMNKKKWLHLAYAKYIYAGVPMEETNDLHEKFVALATENIIMK